MKKQTPSQTVGPYLRIGLIYGETQSDLVQDETIGERILITGTVFDGNDEPITDAMIEIWQPDAQGIFKREKEVSVGQGFPPDERGNFPLRQGFADAMAWDFRGEANSAFRAGRASAATLLVACLAGKEKHRFSSIDDFRGKMSQEESEKPEFYERMQYIRAFVGIE